MTDFTTIPLKAAAPLPRRQWLKSTLLSGTGVSVAAALSVPLQACGGTDSCEDESMKGFPDFFNQAPVMRVRDRLAEFLGAAEGGVMDYHYVDAVRLAGHSCPTVAGAYLMTVKGMRALYGSDMPERGNIEVLMSNGREEGVTGVIASVATLLTGAAAATLRIPVAWMVSCAAGDARYVSSALPSCGWSALMVTAPAKRVMYCRLSGSSPTKVTPGTGSSSLTC